MLLKRLPPPLFCVFFPFSSSTHSATPLLLQEVSGISQMLPLSEPGDPGCLISAAWLETWANSEEGRGPVDNGPLLCSHGALSPDKPPGSFKYLSSTAWEALVVSGAVVGGVGAG